MRVLRLIICALTFSPLGAAFAQGAPAAVNVAQIPVRAAASAPAVGEEVVNQNGAVSSAHFIESRICNIKGCRSFIFDKRSGALIKNDRVWIGAYARTGRGGQVIRVTAFTNAERPALTPPSDAPLDTAPGISKVSRPKPPK